MSSVFGSEAHLNALTLVAAMATFAHGACLVLMEAFEPGVALYLMQRERIGQHLWDLGFLGNDAGLAFGLAQFSRLREEWLRVSQALFGHRYLMDTIVPGGVTRNVDAAGIARMREEIEDVTVLVRALEEANLLVRIGARVVALAGQVGGIALGVEEERAVKMSAFLHGSLAAVFDHSAPEDGLAGGVSAFELQPDVEGIDGAAGEEMANLARPDHHINANR